MLKLLGQMQCPTTNSWSLRLTCVWGIFGVTWAADAGVLLQDKSKSNPQYAQRFTRRRDARVHGRRVDANKFMESSCDGTSVSLNSDEANGTSCPSKMLDGEFCTLTCNQGFSPIGFFFCSGAATSLIGSPSCEEVGMPLVAATRIYGTFKLVAVRHWTTGLGADFRLSVAHSLAEALVIELENIRRLHVDLRLPAGSDWGLASELDVSYEILLNHSFWHADDIECILDDINKLNLDDWASHTELVRAMASEGYPVVHVHAGAEPAIFEDAIPLSVDPGPVVSPQALDLRDGRILTACSGILVLMCCIGFLVPASCLSTYVGYDIEQPMTVSKQSHGNESESVLPVGPIGEITPSYVA